MSDMTEPNATGEQNRQKLKDVVTALGNRAGEMHLEAVMSGQAFDAGLVEGMSHAVELIESEMDSLTGEGSKLERIVSSLENAAQAGSQEAREAGDAFSRGVAAGAGHVAEVLQEEVLP